MPREIEVLLKPRLDAVTVRPGDTLIIRAAGITEQQARQIIEHITASMPGVNTEVLRVDQILVYRPDGEE